MGELNACASDWGFSSTDARGFGTPVPVETMGGRTSPTRPLAVDWAALPEDYDRYFVILPESDLLKGLSPFIIHRELLSAVGELKKLRNGTILVMVANSRQSEKVLKLKKPHNIEVTVTPHTTLNFCKGTISSRDMSVCTDEKILGGLTLQGVRSVKWIVSRKNGDNMETNSFIFTFRKDRILNRMKSRYLSLRVRQYIQNPMRCYQCQRFGHVSMKCTYAPTSTNVPHRLIV
ncbi:uncharacterized protein LOC143197399 [Rhynchophorus ferrugineus]|uniref:uncharacterized protein LOC143197399 n=1 Tax=Rhynchophorus ferrugineus TaxID=354439 RepID=UPI003FCCB6C0